MSTSSNRDYTVQYSLLPFFYWGAFCSVISYASYYLLSIGYKNSTIGVIIAVAGIFSAVLQPIVASYADRADSMSLKKIVLLIAGIQVLGYLALFFVHQKVFVLSGFLYAAEIGIHQLLTPLINSLGTETLNQGKKLNYGVSRAMGSIGYAIVAFILGRITANSNSSSVLLASLVLLFLLEFFLILFPFQKQIKVQTSEKTPFADQISAKSFQIKDGTQIPTKTAYTDQISSKSLQTKDGTQISANTIQTDNTEAISTSTKSVAATTNNHNNPAKATPSTNSGLAFFQHYKRFSILLIGCILIYISHVMINNFTLQIVQSKGGGPAEMGTAQGIASIIELPVMFLFGWFLKKASAATWFKISGFFFFIKTFVTLLVPNMPAFYAIQIFQMFGWALITVSSVYYINSVMEDQNKIKGQAYFTMTYTIGCVFGSLLGGALLESFSANAMLICGSGCGLIGAVIMFLMA